jgi:membrane protein
MWRTLRLFQETTRLFSQVRATMLAAAVSFYTIFSLAPIAVIAVAVAGFILEDEIVRAQIEEQVRVELGPEPARLVSEMMAQTARPQAGIIASVTGLLLLLFGATRLFVQLQEALNQVWGRPPSPGVGLRRQVTTLVQRRLLSFGLVLLMGLLLLASVVASTAVSAAGIELGQWIPISAGVIRLLEIGAIGLLMAFPFSVTFKILPDLPVSWRSAVLGGLVTAALFSVGRVALGLYLGREAVASGYGAAGAFVVVLLWVYYSSIVFFFGAVFTRAYTEERNRPKTYAPKTRWIFVPPPAWRRGERGSRPPSGDGSRTPSP